MHVLTPAVFAILERQFAAEDDRRNFSDVLSELARQEQYLALAIQGWRYDVGVKYGLLSAQLSLALSGVDREQVLTHLLELLALRQLNPEADERSS